jgi:glyoxylase-like metal-dependent hydrolase (beta-lactamase superfamily II)
MSASKLPRLVLQHTDSASPHTLFAFPPNRETLGGTAYFLVEPAGNILIDCPAWDDTHRDFLLAHGGVQWLFITHRGGIGQARAIQTALGCALVIQEQEAYLIPGANVTSFSQEFTFSDNSHAFWTAGHSPGSACLYHKSSGSLFSGRHLLPDRDGNPTPLRTAKTFHWPRQIRNTQKLIDQFTSDTLRVICPGASLGLLRGKPAIADAYEKLTQLDLTACLQAAIVL